MRIKEATPLGSKIFVLTEEPQPYSETKSGLLVAVEAKEQLPSEGEVVAVGPGVKEIRPEQRIAFPKGKGLLFPCIDEFEDIPEGCEVVIMREQDVQAIIN